MNLAPGPWAKYWHGGGTSLMVIDAEGRIVADVTNWLLSKKQCEATADLLIEARNRLMRPTISEIGG